MCMVKREMDVGESCVCKYNVGVCYASVYGYVCACECMYACVRTSSSVKAHVCKKENNKI